MAKVGDAKSNTGLAIGTYAILGIVGFVMVFPFVLAVATSFKSSQDVFNYPPRILPRTTETREVTATTAPAPATTISAAASDLLGIDITAGEAGEGVGGEASAATPTTNPFLPAEADAPPATDNPFLPDGGGAPAEGSGSAEASNRRPLFRVVDERGTTQRWVLVEDGISANTYVDPQNPSFSVVRTSDQVTDLGRTIAFGGQDRPVFRVTVNGAARELVQAAGFTLAGRYADPSDLSKSVLRLKSDAKPVERISFRTQNYPDLLDEVTVDRSLTNTILVTVGVVLGQCVTSILGGYAFARLKFRGRDKVFLAYLGSSMIPFVVLIVPLFQQVVAIDWKDRLVVLILPFLFTPYGTFLMRQFFLQLPVELEEAAVIDGASRSRILWRILVPNATPAIATLASFSFLYAWNSFLWPFIAINSGNQPNHVLSISLSVLGGQGADNPQLTLAAVVISMLPPILVFISAQKYFVESAASSAVKG
jgi:multiple sugar transport system permease protein